MMPRILPRSRSARHAAVAALYFALAIALQAMAGAYESGFGGYPDEPAHYVTGQMVREYVLHHMAEAPMKFAEYFYLHYPVMAFGHWPPVFYVLQAAWTMVFEPSRMAVLLLMAVLSAATATILHGSIARRFTQAHAFGIGLMFVALPIIQAHTSLVMAEVPLVMFSLLAVLAYSRYLEEGQWRHSAWFGIWATLAIMTKGNGWALAALPPLAIILTRRYGRLLTPGFWIPVPIVAIAGAPFTLLTMRMVTDGWDAKNASLSHTAQAAPVLANFLVGITGLPFALLAACGLLSAALVVYRNRRAEPYWACMASLICCVLAFHSIVPTSIEARKLVMAIPALLVFGAAGINTLFPASVLARIRLKPWAAAVLVPVACAAAAFQLPRATPHTIGSAAQAISQDPSLRHAVVLVSSSESGELAFVAEMAEHGRLFDHIVLRAGKQLARSDWLGRNYRLLYPGVDEVHQALTAIPVNVVVLHTAGGSKPHHDLLRKALRDYASEWQRVSGIDARRSGESSGETIEVYRLRRPIVPGTRKVEVEMSEKLNRTISGVF